MNILVVSDVFLMGGLETNIKTFYDNLKINNKIIIATGSFNTKLLLDGADIHEGFNFKNSATVEQFIADVNRLLQIIEKEQIDCIISHPFYSFFPAVFAANISNTKIIYTCHGRYSVTFPIKPTETMLFEHILDSFLNKTFCVSQDAMDSLSQFKEIKKVWIPNFIDTEVYKYIEFKRNKKWALISRLDSDKLDTILLLLEEMANLDIKSVDIIGDGNAKDIIITKAKKIKINVNFLGFSNNIPKVLENGYSGICGMGRTALEGLAANLPTLFYGYGKIAGIIDKEIYDKIKRNNFVPEDLPNIDLLDLQEQIASINSGKVHDYQLRDIVVKDFDIRHWNQIIIDEIEKTKNISKYSFTKLMNEIRSLESHLSFYDNPNVFYKVYYNINDYTYNLDLKVKNNIFFNMIYLQNQINVIKQDVENIYRNPEFKNRVGNNE